MEKALASQSEGVEVMSRQLHPGGIMLDPAGGDHGKAHDISMDFVSNGAGALFQPTFCADGLMARVDILYRDGDGSYVLREVKSSSPPGGETHTTDAAFQYNVLTKAGVNVSRVELLLLNREYIREGAIDPSKLFVSEDITTKVHSMQGNIETLINEARSVDTMKEAPEVSLDDPRTANLSDDEMVHYRKDLRQEGSVLLMPKTGVGRKKNIALAAQLKESNDGNISAAGIDDSILNQVAAQSGRRSADDHPENTNKLKAAFRIATATQAVICDSACIAETISKIKFPAVFIDFETYLSALPPHDGCRPNDQIPFLVCMIRIDSPDSTPVVSTVIAEPDGGDPRPKIAKAILSETKDAACLVAYNASFEKTVMKNLAKVLPEEQANEMTCLIPKFEDIAEPFRKGDFYHPEQYGKTGLKRVAGVVLKNRPYDGLDIINGATAAGVYLQAISEDVREWRKAKDQLKKYCVVDVQCMINVLAAMEKYAGLPKEHQRFRNHASIGVRAFGSESIIDADPRTMIHIRDTSVIESMTIDGRDMKKCGAVALGKGESVSRGDIARASTQSQAETRGL
jgi:hypothetical protein